MAKPALQLATGLACLLASACSQATDGTQEGAAGNVDGSVPTEVAGNGDNPSSDRGSDPSNSDGKTGEDSVSEANTNTTDNARPGDGPQSAPPANADASSASATEAPQISNSSMESVGAAAGDSANGDSGTTADAGTEPQYQGGQCQDDQCTEACSDATDCGGDMDCCRGACVNTDNDPDHCGGCGLSCEGHACEDAECVDERCAPGYGSCNSSPSCSIDFNTNPEHCGDCDTVCDPGLSCQDGTCEQSPFAEIVAGDYETCVRRENGRVLCWGFEGTFSVNDWGIADATQVTLGNSFGCALLKDSSVTCWGINSVGQLGTAELSQYWQSPVETGIRDVKRITAGDTHMCAVKKDGSVVCWGEGQNFGVDTINGQVGPNVLETTIAGISGALDVSAGSSGNIAQLDTGEVVDWGVSTTGDGSLRSTPQVVGMGADAIEGGGRYFCLRQASDEHDLCWGLNEQGSAGLGADGPVQSPTPVPNLGAVDSINVGKWGNPCATKDGDVWCWGANLGGIPMLPEETQLATVPNPVDIHNVSDIAVGSQHACAIVKDGREPLCWGDNASAQLGRKTNQVSFNPVGPVDFRR